MIEKLQRIPIIRYLFDKSFAHYTIASISISLLNIFLLWLFIDIFDIPTIISSVLVVGGTFFVRYALLRMFKIM